MLLFWTKSGNIFSTSWAKTPKWLLFLGSFLCTSCSNDDEPVQPKVINGSWNLTKISGGFAGIDDDYIKGTITWTFNNQTLFVVNNASAQGTIYSGFETGNYTYSTFSANGIAYVVIDDGEFGGYKIDANSMIINQNQISIGSGADGFVLQFER